MEENRRHRQDHQTYRSILCPLLCMVLKLAWHTEQSDIQITTKLERLAGRFRLSEKYDYHKFSQRKKSIRVLQFLKTDLFLLIAVHCVAALYMYVTCYQIQLSFLLSDLVCRFMHTSCYQNSTLYLLATSNGIPNTHVSAHSTCKRLEVGEIWNGISSAVSAHEHTMQHSQKQ